ncbi:MAG: hypothetical protein AB1449_13580 [Chloroflexota bacterium]
MQYEHKTLASPQSDPAGRRRGLDRHPRLLAVRPGPNRDATTPPPTPTPEPTPTPAALPGLEGTGAILDLFNDSGRTVCFLNISLSTSDQWGEDWLGATGTIESGARLSFEIAPGTYDMRAQDCDHALIAEQWGVNIAAPGTTWEIPFVPETVTLINNSQTTICYVLISPSTSQSWGSDWLGSSETLPPGSSRNFAVAPGQQYDLQALDCDQNTVDQQMQVMITEAGITWTVTGGSTGGQGAAPTVRIVNQTNTAICYVYISPSTSTEWGEDWLGSDFIAPGTSYNFAVPPGQEYDLRATDCNNNVMAEEYNQFIDTDGITWTLSPQ